MRIILHWTAGNLNINNDELEYYHYIVDEQGLHQGYYTPFANIDCKDGIYAAHTGGYNTGSIGIAICGYKGFESAKQTGDCIPSKVVFERFFKEAAIQAKRFNIEISKEKIRTHAEVGLITPRSAGKIDFNYLPDYWEVGEIIGIEECSNFIRNKVQWYCNKFEEI